MKTVLFIAYDFQPCPNIGGSIRSTKFAEHLPGFGWKSIVCALDTVEARQQGEQFNSVFRIKSLTPFSKPYQITPYGWALSIWLKAFKLLRKNKIDLIYVSCPPFPQTISAVLLKKQFKLPLVVDFRDNWSLDPYQEGSQLKKLIYKTIFPAIESWILKNIDQLILNTPSSFLAYKKKYPTLSNKMNLITNGYDEMDFKELKYDRNNVDKLQLFYAGSFGVGGRDACLLLEALKKGVENGMDVSLHILGKQPSYLPLIIEDLDLKSYVCLGGQVAHKKALAFMLESDVCILYQEPSESEFQAIAGKTFEYVYSGKPILSIAPKGDNQDIVSCYANHYESVTNINVENIYNALKKIYDNWDKGKYKKKISVSEEFIQNYERKVLTGQLAKLFNSLITESPDSISV